MFPFYLQAFLWVSCKCVHTGDSALRERGPQAPLGRADAPLPAPPSPPWAGASPSTAPCLSFSQLSLEGHSVGSPTQKE